MGENKIYYTASKSISSSVPSICLHEIFLPEESVIEEEIEHTNLTNAQCRKILYADALIFANTSMYQDITNVKNERAMSRENELDEIRDKAEQATNNIKLFKINNHSMNINTIDNESELDENKYVMGDNTDFFFEKLATMDYTANDVVRTADLLYYPRSILTTNVRFFQWLNAQRHRGYWYDRASLIILCLTVTCNFSSVDTPWYLLNMWGGLAFIIPYLFIYIFIFMPILSFELCFGQIIRGGPPKFLQHIWFRAKGVGIAMIIACCIYNCIALSRFSAEAFVYLVESFNENPPWKITKKDVDYCINLIDEFNCDDETQCIYSNVLKICVPSELYKASKYLFHRNDAHLKAYSFDVDFEILASLTITWMSVACFQLCGLSNLAFICAATCIIVYVIGALHAFTFFRGNYVVDYAATGLSNSLWKNLLDNPFLWTETTKHLVAELPIATGVYSTLASYSRIGSNVLMETYGIVACKMTSAVVMLTATFSFLMFMATKLGVNVSWIASYVSNSIYVVFPLGFVYYNEMETTFSLVFFLGVGFLLVAGISIFLQIVIVSMQETNLFFNARRSVIVLSLSSISYLCSIIFTTNIGKMLLHYFDIAFSSIIHIGFALIISFLVGWVNGFDKQVENMGFETMLIFNGICWFGFILATIVITLLPPDTLFLLFFLLYIFFAFIAIIFALLLGPKINGYLSRYTFFKNEFYRKKNAHTLPLKTQLWWLLVGNTEDIQKEITRIVTGDTYFFGRLTIFWCLCIKWICNVFLLFSFCYCVKTLIDDLFYGTYLTNSPIIFICFTAFFWFGIILVIFIFLIFPHEEKFTKFKEPAVLKTNLHLLPSNVFLNVKKKLNFWSSFSEFMPKKKKTSVTCKK